MLAHSLHATQRFGFPLEYANPGLLGDWKKQLKTRDMKDTLQELMLRRTSQNGVFGIKMHYVQCRQFGGYRAIRELFPKPFFVLLSREDALAQAVSWALAAQTGEWIHGQEKVSEAPRYDFNDINWRLRRVLVDTAAWRYLLTSNGCIFLELRYETLLNDIPETIQKIASHMDVDLGRAILPDQPSTSRQGKAINKEWRKRFLEECDGEELFLDNMSFVVPRPSERLSIPRKILLRLEKVSSKARHTAVSETSSFIGTSYDRQSGSED